MIKVYETGEGMIQEHGDYLRSNAYLAIFFFADAPLLKQTDKQNYAVMAASGEEKLLGMRYAPYSLLLFGSEALVPEMFSFLKQEEYSFPTILGSAETCACAAEFLKTSFGQDYFEDLAMDFMEAKTVTEPSCLEVTGLTADDVEELLECRQNFVADCGLHDPVERGTTLRILPDFRVIRRAGKIASMARVTAATDSALKISEVYTRPEFRGQGLGRRVVNTLKNEILAQGKTATLNVDKKNPITNHLYTSLGFVRVFSQSQYTRR